MPDLPRTIALAGLGLLLATAGFAQGVIIGPGSRPFPLVRQTVKATIEDQAATTVVEQTFRNPANARLEGTFLFPLPEGAAVSDFGMSVNGEMIQAELLDAKKAREVYEAIVRQQKDPGLLEYLGRSMFRARIFPIEPNERKQVKLEYTQPIEASDGLAKYVLPLKTRAFWGNNIPRPLPMVDDIEPRRPRPPHPQPVPEGNVAPATIENLAIEVTINSGTGIKSVYSPTHEVDLHRDGDKSVTVGYEGTQVQPDDDFVLYWQLSDAMFGLNLLTFRENAGEDGYFMLLLAPRSELRESEIQAKDIVFVFDTSGSMSGDKIEQARQALRFCLENLNKDDRFNVVSFSTAVSAFREKTVAANKKNVKEALEFVDELKARGGTNIEEALHEGLGLLGQSDRPSMMLFLTDGLPTVGEDDELALLKQADKQNDGHARVFALGVGNDVNTVLLDRLAGENGGTRTYVKPHENLEVAVSNLYGKIASPVLGDLRLDVDGVKLSDLNPGKLPDLFRGSQVILLGRYSGQGTAQVVLKGEAGDQEEVFEYSADFPRRNRDNAFIPRLWATRQIGLLLDQIRLHGQNKELVEEVTRLATRYGILTPYTSYLVLEPGMSAESEVSEALRERRVQTRPADAAGAPGMKGDGGGDVYASPAPTEATTGAGAIQRSEGEVALRDADRAWYDANLEVRQAGSRTFYRVDEAWVDSTWPKDTKDRKVLQIKFGSDAYFELATLRKDLQDYLAVGSPVKIDGGELLLSIGEEGLEKLSDADRKLLAE